ncbi:MAG: polymer-forming cytoskeletal protein, partial [Candidatus Njordarchaeales archaeon]
MSDFDLIRIHGVRKLHGGDYSNGFIVDGVLKSDDDLLVDFLICSGVVKVDGDFVSRGDVEVNGSMKIDGDIVIEESLTVSGALNIDGDLRVSNELIVNGAMKVSGDTHCGEANIPGAISIDGDLTVFNDAELSGGFVIHGNLIVNGNLRIILKG